jgi:GPH family glycoside/pentoside/hexuronide:cation symporter
MTEKKDLQQDLKYKYSTLDHISFGFGYFSDTFLTGAIGVRLFAFYETELLLPVLWVLTAYIIYAIWNMINDPILGFIADKPNRFWSKWGRRTPWIVIGALPWPLVYILIFVSPTVSEAGTLVVFLWLLITVCMFDFLYSMWNTNFYSMYPDKYRSHEERTKVAGIGTGIGQIGIALGFIIPPLFIVYGNIRSYIIAAIIVGIISWVGILLMFPGVKEDKEMISRVMLMESQHTQESFIKTFKFAVKQKNFLIYLLAYLCFQSFVFIIIGSIPYWVPYILNMSAENEAVLSVGFLIGSLLSIIFWTFLVKKFGNKTIFIIGYIFTALVLLPLLLISDLITTLILMVLVGIGVGAIWVCVYPIYGDVIDELVVQTKKRQEAIYFGIRIFFARIALIIQAVVFALIHLASGFDPERSNQTELALLGLRFQMALIPMLILFVGGFMFWKWYDLTPNRVESIKSILEKLGL